MLKLSAQLKSEKFEFTELDGSVHNLEITEYTVGDMKKLIDMQSVITDDMAIMDQSELIVCSRIACAVKVQETGEHYWGEIDDIRHANYPNGLIDQLHPIVTTLNPIGTETLGEKKSGS